MSALDSLRSAYNDAVSWYNNAKTAGESYRQEAKKIKKIYDELLEKKADMINNKDSLTSYIDTEYNDWKGKLWSDNYMKDMSALLDSYSVVIQNIDANLVNYKGTAARVEGWGTGGATQWELGLSVDTLQKLGIIEEIPVPPNMVNTTSLSNIIGKAPIDSSIFINESMENK